MNFTIERTLEVLERTPIIVRAMLQGISPFWTATVGDREKWQPFDVLGHLLHGEKTDWVPRAEIILTGTGDRRFVPFDRLAQFEEADGRTLDELIDEFARLRGSSLDTVRSWELTDEQLLLTGVHPEFGVVTLGQLLATWALHDLNHLRQIATVMAAKYDGDVGPWRAYLSILH
jgi:hypothetical protein